MAQILRDQLEPRDARHQFAAPDPGIRDTEFRQFLQAVFLIEFIDGRQAFEQPPISEFLFPTPLDGLVAGLDTGEFMHQAQADGEALEVAAVRLA